MTGPDASASEPSAGEPPLEQIDSRRLTGPNLFWDRPGAVLDVALRPGRAPEALTRSVELWREAARRILDAVGWDEQATCVRLTARSASLVLSAPIDALYAATEVNEQAWESALDTLTGRQPVASLDADARRLRATIAAEGNPPLLALARAARARRLRLLADDDLVSVGSGTGSTTWPARALPAPDAIDWSSIHDVPAALITGTNGKTTTVRLLAAMARAAGRTPGLCSTDGVRVGDEVVHRGDYSGPGGARAVLRHPAVEVALLETARGGLLRRGAATERAEVALITNVAADHLGEFGVEDVPALAEVKLIVARVARSLVLNADDEVLVSAAARRGLVPVWFALEPAAPALRAALERGRPAFLPEGDELVRRCGAERTVLGAISAMPLALGGTARHNVANALAACAVAHGLELPDAAVRRALAEFGAEPDDNPGRLNLYRVGGVEVVVDFAHNPHALEALLSTARSRTRGRLSVVLGQAGDRSDDAIRELAATVARFRPEHCVVKSLTHYLRGRAEGEVEALIERELIERGVSPSAIERAGEEVEALERSLAWALPGDLVLQITHSHREQVLAQLRTLANEADASAAPAPERAEPVEGDPAREAPERPPRRVL
jgi:UDP-N-acetylmuramyl tripeptide synthase